MNIIRAERAMEQTAKNHGVSYDQVYREIEEVIAEAMATNDPYGQALWSMIPCEGECPTPTELIAYLGEVLA